MATDVFQTIVGAIYNDDRSSVEELIARHPDTLSITDDHGWSVLHYAASKGDSSTAEIIVNSGANLDMRDNGGATPLHYAASERNDVAKLLVRAGADVNSTDLHGKTPLHWLAVEGDGTYIVLQLLEAGADPQIRDSNGDTAGDIALLNNNLEIAALLREYSYASDATAPKPTDRTGQI